MVGYWIFTKDLFFAEKIVTGRDSNKAFEN